LYSEKEDWHDACVVTMKSEHNIRYYGKPPYSVTLVHGGPGACGELKPVAEKLSEQFGVMEPMQSGHTIDELVSELHSQITNSTKTKVKLVGYSWGAWLVFIFAGKYPELISKLILVSSGPFEADYAKDIMATRLSRLDSDAKDKVSSLLAKIQNGDMSDETLKEFGAILSRADAFDPIDQETPELALDMTMYQSIWPEAERLRRSGELLELGSSIQCPVYVIHGDYDPHPYEGVKKPLEKTVKNCSFVLLDKCGHKPWVEMHAKDKFYYELYSILRN
jgi:pimeloyl-ACP methyl ester carboxylesterase